MQNKHWDREREAERKQNESVIKTAHMNDSSKHLKVPFKSQWYCLIFFIECIVFCSTGFHSLYYELRINVCHGAKNERKIKPILLYDGIIKVTNHKMEIISFSCVCACVRKFSYRIIAKSALMISHQSDLLNGENWKNWKNLTLSSFAFVPFSVENLTNDIQ